MPRALTRFARHCIGVNHIAIGIENAGDEAKFPLTEAQVAADAALVRDLAAPSCWALGAASASRSASASSSSWSSNDRVGPVGWLISVGPSTAFLDSAESSIP